MERFCQSISLSCFPLFVNLCFKVFNTSDDIFNGFGVCVTFLPGFWRNAQRNCSKVGDNSFRAEYKTCKNML